MLYYDAWFDRLWTRQDGLYAAKLDFMALNTVDCLRYDTSQSNDRKWVTEGDNRLRREMVFTLIADKLKYHGAPLREGYHTAAFFNMVYVRNIRIDHFEGQISPLDGYSPIDEAWRSNRATTKSRDYVLAIFPDIKGYQVPSNARAYKFRELLLDAINQLVGQGPPVALKVIDTLMNPGGAEQGGTIPFILEQPDSASEAFDTFTTLDSEPRDATTPKYANKGHPEIVPISSSLRLETISMTPDDLPALVTLWSSTANNRMHYLTVCLSGPCLANNWGVSPENLCFRYLAFQFGKVRIDEWVSTQPKFKTPSSPHGIVNWENLRKTIGDPECEVLIQRFMTCLICGCSLRTTDHLLTYADFKVLETPFAKLLALVNKKEASLAEHEEYILVNRSFGDFEAFHIAIRRVKEDGYRTVGRTWISKRSTG
jgi:hypothetical protein